MTKDFLARLGVVSALAVAANTTANAVEIYLQEAERRAEVCTRAKTNKMLIGIIDGTTCFFANIDQGTAREFLALPIDEASVLVVSSGGGDADAAIDMAYRILTSNMTIVVTQQCASSCANYLFLAARRKFVLRDAFVAWHGGPGPAKATSRWRQYHDYVYARSELFFDIVGVDSRLVHVPAPGSGVTEENKAFRFWSYRKEDLERQFNVQGIVYMWWIADGEKPPT